MVAYRRIYTLIHHINIKYHITIITWRQQRQTSVLALQCLQWYVVLFCCFFCMKVYDMMRARYSLPTISMIVSLLLLQIIFDKDGTLGDCTPSLKVWRDGMATHIQNKCTSTNLSQHQTNFIIAKFDKAIGWDASSNDVMPSAPLSAGSWDDIVMITYSAIIETIKFFPTNAPSFTLMHSEVVEWHTSLGDVHSNDTPLVKNLPSLFQSFKDEYGIMISICTSDNRSSTNKCLSKWGINTIVDYTLCGDEVEEPKPSVLPLLELCGRAGVHPHEVWM